MHLKLRHIDSVNVSQSEPSRSDQGACVSVVGHVIPFSQ